MTVEPDVGDDDIGEVDKDAKTMGNSSSVFFGGTGRALIIRPSSP